MARTNRRIYANRRKRSPNKMFAPQNTGPRVEYSADELATKINLKKQAKLKAKIAAKSTEENA